MPEKRIDETEMNDDAENAITRRASQNTALSPSYGPYLQTLPATRSLPKSAIADIDADEGIHPTAAERVSADPRKSLYELMSLAGAAGLFVIVLLIAFPWKHFLKPSAHEIAIGPQTQTISDEDVRQLGGIEKLTPVQLAVHEISGLRGEGRLNAARDKSADYINKIRNPNEHATWMPVWRHYLEVLDRLKQTDTLVAQCDRLKKVVPDSPEAVYYPAKLSVQTVPRLDSYKKKERESHSAMLKDMARDCQVAEASLAERKNDPGATVMLNGFRLLLADIFRRQWWVSEFSWDDDNRERAFEYLRKLPDDSKQASDMRLSLLRDCEREWFHFWRNDPKTRVIDGQSITHDNLRQMIQREESK